MMPGRQSRAKESKEDGVRQPLLPTGSNSNASSANSPFALGEDDSDDEVLHDTRRVRSEDNVPVYAPLRSTVQSRETEFEQDSDELENTPGSHHGRGYDDRSMPLLVGLMESSSARRSMDMSFPLHVNGFGHIGSTAELEELATKKYSGGGLLDSVANMANSILGAGIIGLPYAVSQAGFVTGLFLLVVLCIITDWTIRLIVINAKMSGRNSYIEIMHQCFGSSGRAAVSIFQFAFAFGGMCAFGIIIGDTIPHVIRSLFPTLQNIPVLSILTNRQFVIALCTICVSYPLSLYRDINKLSWASGLALIGMLIIVTSVLIEGPHVPPELRGDQSKRFTIIAPGVSQAIGVISFAFVCHHNSLLIYGSLRTPTLDRFAKVTHISTLVSFVACCALAISAYLVFTDKTHGNILNNFPGDDTLINLARFCFGLNMFTTLPLELFVCREVIEQYFFSHEAYSTQRHLLFTTAILFSSMVVALITCELGVVLEITGGVSATALAFIFPAACYLKLIDHRKPWYSRTKLPAVACTAFGVCVMAISLFLALRKTLTSEGDAKICT